MGHRCLLNNNIKMDLKDVGWEDTDWRDLDQDRKRGWAVVNLAMNLLVP